MICLNCSSEFQGRSDARYCSSRCKQEAHKKRKISGLSDNMTVEPFVYKPNYLSSNQHVSNRMTNGLLNGVTGGLGSTLNDGIGRMTNPNNHPFSTLSMLVGSGLGGYIGYNLSENGKKLSGVIIGVGGGLLAGQLAYTLYIQLNEYNRQRNIYEEQQALQQEPLSDSRVYTSNEIKYMQVNTIKFDGVYAGFIGQNINFGFSILVYGSAGGGKSHFATQFSKYLERIGNVLYVLAEEGVTNSVQARIERYGTQNTDFIQTRLDKDVLEKIPSYKFVVIDSINGMINYNNHLEFIRKLKSFKHLYGIIILNQVNKDGAFTGKNEVLHEIDVEISVENGIAETKKNRFEYGGKKLNIFPQSKEVSRVIPQFSNINNLIGN